MLDNDQGFLTQGRLVQGLQRAGQGAAVAVRRIQQQKVVGGEVAFARPQPVDGIGTCNVALLGEAGSGRVLSDDVSTGTIAVHESGRRGAARERLAAERSGS